MKKMTRQQIIGITSILLVAIFGLTMNQTYNLGYYNGGRDACSPLMLGVDKNDEVLCFDADTMKENGWMINPNFTLEVSQWR